MARIAKPFAFAAAPLLALAMIGGTASAQEAPLPEDPTATPETVVPEASPAPGAPDAQPFPPTGAPDTAMDGLPVETLLGSTVVTSDGQSLGTIDRVVEDATGARYVVVSVGGFLGIGASDRMIPVEDVTQGSTENEVVLIGVTGDDLEMLREYDAEDQTLIEIDA